MGSTAGVDMGYPTRQASGATGGACGGGHGWVVVGRAPLGEDGSPSLLDGGGDGAGAGDGGRWTASGATARHQGQAGYRGDEEKGELLAHGTRW
jgi:hypothetical protein